MSFTRLRLNSSVKSQPVGDSIVHHVQLQDNDAGIITKTIGIAYHMVFAALSQQKSVSNDDRLITDLWYLHPCPSVISFQTQ